MTIEQLKLKSVEELKALAYDQVKLLQMTQQNVQVLESLIAEKSKPVQEAEEKEHAEG